MTTELEKVTAERDEALAVIEKVKEYANRGGHMALTTYLAQSPASALAKAQANMLREIATTYDRVDGLGLEPDAAWWWAWFAESLRTRADGIEATTS